MENIQNTSYGKMWQEHLQTIKDRISAGSLKKSQKPIFQCLIAENGQQPEWLETASEVQLGDSWTLNIGEFPSVENVSTLYTILQATVPGKYYLSAKACLGILRRAEQRGWKLPEVLETALKEQIQWQQAVVYSIAGNVIGRTGKNGGNQLGVNKDISYTLTAKDRHAVAVENYGYRLSGYGEFKEGIGTLRTSGGDNGGGSETMIVQKRLQFADAYCHHGYRLSEIANTQTAGGNISVRGDTSFVLENDVVCFDDFVEDKETGQLWSCICESCAKKYRVPDNLLDEAGQGICGVQGCWNEADFYIDFSKLEKLETYHVRRLTPTECERLDGFPDDWTKYGASGKAMSDTMRYKALGNSIAVPCADRVFAGIVAVEMTGGNNS